MKQTDILKEQGLNGFTGVLPHFQGIDFLYFIFCAICMDNGKRKEVV